MGWADIKRHFKGQPFKDQLSAQTLHNRFPKSFRVPNMQRDTQGVHIPPWILSGCCSGRKKAWIRCWLNCSCHQVWHCFLMPPCYQKVTIEFHQSQKLLSGLFPFQLLQHLSCQNPSKTKSIVPRIHILEWFQMQRFHL